MDESLIVSIAGVGVSIILGIPGIIAYYKSKSKVIVKFGVPSTTFTKYPNALIETNDELIIPMSVINKGGTDITITNLSFYYKGEKTRQAVFSIPLMKELYNKVIAPHSKKNITLPIEFFTEEIPLSENSIKESNIKMYLTDAENNIWHVSAKEIKKLKENIIKLRS